MTSKLIATSLAFCAGVLLTTAASAQVYQLDVTSHTTSNTVLSGDGTNSLLDVLSGSFLFDSTTNAFSNASFTYAFSYNGTPTTRTFSGLIAQAPFRTFDTKTDIAFVNDDSELFFNFFNEPTNPSSPLITSGMPELTTDYRFNFYNGGQNNGDYRTADLKATFSVTAVPEPETYAMFLAGLGLLGFARRSKKA